MSCAQVNVGHCRNDHKEHLMAESLARPMVNRPLTSGQLLLCKSCPAQTINPMTTRCAGAMTVDSPILTTRTPTHTHIHSHTFLSLLHPHHTPTYIHALARAHTHT